MKKSTEPNDAQIMNVLSKDSPALMQMGCGNRTDITAWPNSDVAAFAYPCAWCAEEGQRIFEIHLNTTEVLHYLASRCSFNVNKYLTTFAEMKPVSWGATESWLMSGTPDHLFINESLLSNEKSNLCAVRGWIHGANLEFHVFDIPRECIHRYQDRIGLTFYSIFMLVVDMACLLGAIYSFY